MKTLRGVKNFNNQDNIIMQYFLKVKLIQNNHSALILYPLNLHLSQVPHYPPLPHLPYPGHLPVPGMISLSLYGLGLIMPNANASLLRSMLY